MHQLRFHYHSPRTRVGFRALHEERNLRTSPAPVRTSRRSSRKQAARGACVATRRTPGNQAHRWRRAHRRDSRTRRAHAASLQVDKRSQASVRLAGAQWRGHMDVFRGRRRHPHRLGLRVRAPLTARIPNRSAHHRTVPPMAGKEPRPRPRRCARAPRTRPESTCGERSHSASGVGNRATSATVGR